MSQAVKCDLFLYVDNKQSIQFGEDKKNQYFFLRNLKEKNSKKT